MIYTEAEHFIKESHNGVIRLGLGRIEELLERLGCPQKKLKFIHVAGTNGKGSVCAMTAEILKAAGYKTGLFTSPVISVYREQFRINGEMISEGEFVRYAELVRNACAKMTDVPSEFEKAVALAFLYFNENRCDFVVLEVGMGGCDDATNVIEVPEVAAIVNIDYDHMGFLGTTLEEIAQKKAGIIKENGTVVIAGQSETVMNVLIKRCQEKKAGFKSTDVQNIKITDRSIHGQTFGYKQYAGIRLSLLGDYQCENAAVVLEIMDCLIRKGYQIPVNAVYDGMKNVYWQGRFEILSEAPLFIVDGAHNPDGINALRSNLENYFAGEKFIFITGILRDKDYSQMLRTMLPYAASFITIAPDSPRAMSADECADAVRKCGYTGAVSVMDTIEEAVQSAYRMSQKKNTGVCAFGSLYSVGAISRAGYQIPVNAVYDGMKNVYWQGRFEILSEAPLFIVDGAHNPDGINALRSNLENYFAGEKFIFITGILRDKDYSQMLRTMLPYAASFITIAPDSPRAMSADECADAVRKCGYTGAVSVMDTIEEAVQSAYRMSQKKNTGVCAFGSLYSVGAISRAGTMKLR